MVQVDKSREKYLNDGGSLVASYSKNLAITTTDSYVTILDIDSRGVRESIISIYNSHATNSIDYIVYGCVDLYPNADITGTAATDYANGWVILKDTTALAGLAVPVIETLTNPYARVVVQVRATVGASQGTVSAYHRGEN